MSFIYSLYNVCLFFITADIYETIGEDELKNCGAGLDTECVGGGRINHNAPAKTIKVYGYSQVGEAIDLSIL